MIGLKKMWSSCDAPEAWQVGFQDPATPGMEGVVEFHHDLMFFLGVIFGFVLWMLGRTVGSFRAEKHREPEATETMTWLELVWTFVPTVVLLTMAMPSFALLYGMDQSTEPALTVKVTGKQWLWDYEYPDHWNENWEVVGFESYMLPEDELEEGDLRMLEVDHRVVLPVETDVRILVTSSDVVHSWSVPSLGVKCDAVPGKASSVMLYVKREGVFYGQCSELCGVNHGMMPIVVEAVQPEDYASWVLYNLYAEE